MKKKVLVAMSGGVDSSVACALLKERGFEVTGVTLRLFDPGDKIDCCGSDSSGEKAREACDALGMRHYFKDARRYFSKNVVEKFAAAYLEGNTPNPCVECNRFLKFDYLFKIARALDMDYLATGHYARIEEKNGEYSLLRGKDENKDQSYFLYCVGKERLKHVIFPLGELKKEETRKIAAGYGLAAAREKESRDICFIPGGDYPAWLKRRKYAENAPGYIKDIKGKILGRHNGYFNFTVGQRKNLGVSSGERLYVVGINPAGNEVTVSGLENACFSGFRLGGLDWLAGVKPEPGNRLCSQIRYRHKPCEGIVESFSSGSLVFRFFKKQFAVTAGQSAVFYEGERVLGGGVIEEAIR